jgi:hypothetical protein
MFTEKAAVADLESHLATQHEDARSSALRLDRITRQILHDEILAPISSPEVVNHVLGLYGEAMAMVSRYIDKQGQDELLVGALRNLNHRYVNLTRLRDRLPIAEHTTIDNSGEAIRANIEESRRYLQPQS